MNESKEEHENYSKHEGCRECGHVAAPSEAAFNGVCNKCGAERIDKVVGRWWFSMIIDEFGFRQRVYRRFERRGDT